MAMTKGECIAQGAGVFNSGLPRPPGESWQAKARQDGWDAAQAIPIGASLREAFNVGRRQALPDAVNEHLRCMRVDAIAECNPKRHERLMRAIDRIETRWGL